MNAEGRAFEWLRNAVVGMFVAAILGGFFLPVYTDEVGWRFQERAALDGVDKLFSDMCGPNTLAAPPFFMMPVRYYSAFFNTSFADPFYVRLSGILYALVWLALLVVLIRRIAISRPDRMVLTIIGVGLLCLGTMPLLLVWSRPEQPIVLAATAALLIAWKQDAGDAAVRTSWARSIGILLLATIALSYHLKAVFLLPLFLACLFFASRGRQASLPRLAAGAVMIAMAGWSTHYWIHRLQCSGDPILFASFAQHSLGVELTNARDWTGRISAMVKIIGNVTLLDYFGMPVPRPNPLSNWLEPGQIAVGPAFAWFRGLILAWSVAVLLAAIAIYVQLREAWQNRRLDPRPILAALLLGTALAWSATQVIRNVYEAGFVLPLVMLGVVLVLSAPGRGERIGKWVNVLAAITGLCALASPLAVATIYAPSFARAKAQTGYLAAQPYSLAPFGYASLEPDIRGAARKCGIGDPAKAKALMVDDITYFTFMKSRLPQHYLGVVSIWKGSIADPMAYLRSKGSDGAIVSCHLLPPGLRARAKSQGQFCCLGPPNW